MRRRARDGSRRRRRGLLPRRAGRSVRASRRARAGSLDRRDLEGHAVRKRAQHSRNGARKRNGARRRRRPARGRDTPRHERHDECHRAGREKHDAHGRTRRAADGRREIRRGTRFLLSAGPRREDSYDRRQHFDERRWNARGEVRRHARLRARAHGRAAERRHRGAWRKDREELVGLLSQGLDRRLRGNSGHRRARYAAAAAASEGAHLAPRPLSGPAVGDTHGAGSTSPGTRRQRLALQTARSTCLYQTHQSATSPYGPHEERFWRRSRPPPPTWTSATS